RRGVPGRARRAGGAAADRPPDARRAARMRKAIAAAAAAGALAAVGLIVARKGRVSWIHAVASGRRPDGSQAPRREAPCGGRAAGWRSTRHVLGRLRLRRGLAALQLAARGGARYTRSAPRLFASAGRSREQLRNDLALQTAEDVANTLGAMKGVLMKIGQMASYVDDGLSPAARRTLSRLQDSVPPMSAHLAAGAGAPEPALPPP